MSDTQPAHSADYGRYDLSHWDGHQSWHMLVPQSITGGLGWCLDCLRIVPVPALNDGDACE